jgi:hypothetical protein
MYGRNCCAKACLGVRIQRQRNDQSLRCISVGVCDASFELLDTVHTQASAIGEPLLRQAGRLSISAQQGAKPATRVCAHRRRQTDTEVANPPACTLFGRERRCHVQTEKPDGLDTFSFEPSKAALTYILAAPRCGVVTKSGHLCDHAHNQAAERNAEFLILRRDECLVHCIHLCIAGN